MLYTCADRVYVPLFDRLLYRHPFECRSARRYARDARPAFGDFDDRLLDALAPALDGAERLLDLGCGPGELARRAGAGGAALQIGRGGGGRGAGGGSWPRSTRAASSRAAV